MFGKDLPTAEALDVIRDRFEALDEVGTLAAVATDSNGVPGYRVKASAVRWVPGDGNKGADDPLRRRLDSEAVARVNPFFRDLYRDVAIGLAGLHAKEHTAQVPPDQREDREKDFREGTLPLLYCSPTMELGVDISSLNAVSLRNVPPTPANYAQRSGRAGRSGQPALVTTYCANGNAHDSHWFRRSRDMVAGSVQPPRLDLGNEELIRSHVHAIWLSETDQSMKSRITDLVDAVGDDPTLTILPEIWKALTEERAVRNAVQRAQRVLTDLRSTWNVNGDDVTWWYDGWCQLARDPAGRGRRRSHSGTGPGSCTSPHGTQAASVNASAPVPLRLRTGRLSLPRSRPSAHWAAPSTRVHSQTLRAATSCGNWTRTPSTAPPGCGHLGSIPQARRWSEIQSRC